MKIRHTQGRNPWTHLSYSSVKRTEEMPAHSSLPPDMAPSTMWHSLGEHTHVGTKCINATLTRRVCSLSPALSRTCGLITECGSILEYVSIIILDTHQRIVDILRDYYTETLDMPVPAKVGHCAKRSFPRDEKSLSSIKIHQWNMIHKQDHKTRRRFPTLQTAQVSPSIPRTSCKHPRL